MAKNAPQATQGNPLISMGSDFAFLLWPESILYGHAYIEEFREIHENPACSLF
jgi:hypothetical protein